MDYKSQYGSSSMSHFEKGIGEYISELKKGGGETQDLIDPGPGLGVTMQQMEYPGGYLVLFKNKCTSITFDGTFTFELENLKIEENPGNTIKLKLIPGEEELFIVSFSKPNPEQWGFNISDQVFDLVPYTKEGSDKLLREQTERLG
jgi:hypothetical protein